MENVNSGPETLLVSCTKEAFAMEVGNTDQESWSSLEVEEEDTMQSEATAPSEKEMPNKPLNDGSCNAAARTAAVAKDYTTKDSTCDKKKNATKTNSKVRRKSVRFDTLNVFEFPVNVGDHPAVQSGGPPIQLDYGHCWDALPVHSYTLKVEDYERNKQKPRSGAELRIPANLRREWVLNTIACKKTAKKIIKAAENQVQKIQSQRTVSMLMQEFEDWQIAHQSAVRKMKRWWNRNEPVPENSAEAWVEQHKETQKMLLQQRKLERKAKQSVSRSKKDAAPRASLSDTTTTTELTVGENSLECL